MIKNYNYHNLIWVDVTSPTNEDVSSLVKKYSLNPVVGDVLLSPIRNPKVSSYKEYILLTLRIPIRTNNDNKKRVIKKEIDFVIGRNFIITSHAENIEPLHVFGKAFETNIILDKRGIGDHAGLIFYYIMQRIYAYMKNDLENIKDELERAEEHVFTGHERKMVEVLSDISRELIDFKQTIRLHHEVLVSFEAVPYKLFDEFLGKDMLSIAHDIRGEYEDVHNIMANCRELVNDLKETNTSLFSYKQNENMKLFSILAFVTFPLTLLLNLFSLPTSHIPLIGYKYDWEIIALTIIVLAFSMFYFFKKKKWL